MATTCVANSGDVGGGFKEAGDGKQSDGLGVYKVAKVVEVDEIKREGDEFSRHAGWSSHSKSMCCAYTAISCTNPTRGLRQLDQHVLCVGLPKDLAKGSRGNSLEDRRPRKCE